MILGFTDFFNKQLKSFISNTAATEYMSVCESKGTYVKRRRGEEDVRGLCDIGSMEAIVVRYVSMVMIFQGHHVRDKGVHWNSKSLQQLPLLRGVTTPLAKPERSCDGSRVAADTFTWKMAYMTQLRGLLLENSATLKMLKLHLSRSSSSWWKTCQREGQ